MTGLLAHRQQLAAIGQDPLTMVRSASGFFTSRPIVEAYNAYMAAFGATAQTATDNIGLTRLANEWTAKATATPNTPNGLINPLLPRPVPAGTAFIMTTADAFQLRLKSPFNPEATKEGSFTAGDGSTALADIMNAKFAAEDGVVFFNRANGTRGAILPYGTKGEISLRLTEVPPDVASGKLSIADWFKVQTVSPFARIMQSARVIMPRADINGDRDTIPTRKAMGIDAIYGSDADLTGVVADGKPGYPRIGISKEVAKLKINEIVTEGAVVQVDVARSLGPPTLNLDKTYMLEVIVGDGKYVPGRPENVVMLAVVNKPGRLPKPTR